MRFDVLTLFPDMFTGFIQNSMIQKAHEKGLIETRIINFRDYAFNKHRTVDDIPYGGGDGMVLKPEPFFEAIDDLIDPNEEKPPVLLMSPQGERLTQQKVNQLATHSRLILLCGHYAGFDERIHQYVATEEISIGDYVLTGGELPAMIIMDSVSRQIPGVLGNTLSAQNDSFADGLLEYPQYTRPAEYRGYQVPEVLLSGHHLRIEKWRRQESLRRTWERRPELLDKVTLTEEDRIFLRQLEDQQGE
ncbi:tRNA (guanosine(37)-N1)-methyltransferase TrmD [Seinonella peptonophila]|uniref:tRNA (guanosine(37)-N1)-methyltransferase TrmD n=1 Tax=Seinonella peptonophila TaxID=112248 RepID=UPI000932DBA5|nr:tRNA (guanosine(37)-N1)-methyltransferase TrmD [Seinonella peptonophila]